jgi:DNA-binding NtrC family response regulator
VEILIIERDKVIRDQLKVGLQNFRQFSVECCEGFSGVNRARQKTFDYVFIGLNPQDQEGAGLLKAFRDLDKDTDVVIVTTHRQSKLMSGDKMRFNIFAFLGVPIDVREFFRVVARFKPRMPSAAKGH